MAQWISSVVYILIATSSNLSWIKFISVIFKPLPTEFRLIYFAILLVQTCLLSVIILRGPVDKLRTLQLSLQFHQFEGTTTV